jgi:shikimate kinase
MRIFLAGVSDVGKTTVGAILGDLLHCRFFDLDAEIERFFGIPVERLRDSHLMIGDFRRTAAKALKHVLALPESSHCVIALPPSGLMGGYWNVVKRAPGTVVIVLADTPENILERITFYDIDSRLIERTLTPSEKALYLRKIKQDIGYFKRSFQRAHACVDVSGCGPDAAARGIGDALSLLSSRKLATNGQAASLTI